MSSARRDANGWSIIFPPPAKYAEALYELRQCHVLGHVIACRCLLHSYHGAIGIECGDLPHADATIAAVLLQYPRGAFCQDRRERRLELLQRRVQTRVSAPAQAARAAEHLL